MDRAEMVKQLTEFLTNDLKDSITVGNSKTGEFKVYLDIDDLEGSARKIENAKKLLNLAKEGIL